MLPSWLNPFFKGEIGFISIEPLSRRSFILLLIPLFFLRRRGKSAGYLLCFYVFSLYVWSVLAYTLFPFPVHSIEATHVRMRSWSNEVRLVPSILSGELDLRSEQVIGNFLLGVPFGFGLPFIVARSTPRQILLRGLGFAAGIELAQLLLGLLIYQAPYRVIDIDDVWLVFTGTLAGYGALLAAAHLYRRIGWGREASVPVWDHLHGVLLRAASGHAPSTEPGAPPPRGAEPR
jgi:glycopeptide antibiotics resistance protein